MVGTEAFEDWWELYKKSISFPIRPLNLFDHSIIKSAMTRRFMRGIIKAP